MSSSTSKIPVPGGAGGTGFWSRTEKVFQFIAPSGLGLAALYFLGQIYNSAYYSYFGIDPTTVDISIPEQAIQGRSVILPILAAGLISWFATILVSVIGSTLASSNVSAPARRRLIIFFVSTTILAYLSLLMVGLRANVRIGVLAFSIIIVLTGSISISAIRWLVKSATGTAAAVTSATRNLKVVVWCILIFTAFTSAINYARVVGSADAKEISLHISTLPRVAIISKQPLSFENTAPPSMLPAGQSTFRYAYADFYVLKHTNTRWLLIQPKWKRGGGRVYVLTDDKDLQVEFISR